MSGGYVPYTVRQNKAIDRYLFVELLHRLQARLPIRSYRYVGFGGPFLEDMKLIHAHLGITKLISLEIDERVLKRQQFNKPVSCVELLQKKSRDFLDEDGFESPTILWLDYASPNQIRQQLEEIQMTCGKMAMGDVLRVTLNANMAAYIPQMENKNAAERASQFKAKVGADFHPASLPESVFEETPSFPAVLLKCVERAVKKGAANSDCVFQLLAAYVYTDGSHLMLTVSGVMQSQNKDERANFLDACDITKWEFATTEWGEHLTTPKQIRIPDLSLRERLYLDAHLPKLRSDRRLAERVLKRVGPALTNKEDDEKIALNQYAQFYRHFPYLSRIIV